MDCTSALQRKRVPFESENIDASETADMDSSPTAEKPKRTRVRAVYGTMRSCSKEDFEGWWARGNRVMWIRQKTYRSGGGQTDFFDCRYKQRKGNACPMKLRVKHEGGFVEVQQSIGEHLHDKEDALQYPDVRKMILNESSLGRKPRQIRELLEKQLKGADLGVPTLQQIQNLISRGKGKLKQTKVKKPLADVDSNAEKEKAKPDVGDDVRFAADLVERAEAERFRREQERLQERHGNRLVATANSNEPASTLTANTLNLNAINAQFDERHTTRQLSFGDDAPSSDNWETLFAATKDNLPDDEADRDQNEFVDRDLSGRFSVSTFGGAGTRLSFYRDSPSPSWTPVQEDQVAAATMPVNKLRFDNDTSDGEAETTHASALSYEKEDQSITSFESASEHSQRMLRVVDNTSTTEPKSSSMALNDYVFVHGSRKRRPTIADSFDLLGSMSQKMRKMGVREAPSNATVADSLTDALSALNAVDSSIPKKALSEPDASASEPPLFEEIHGEPDGYTFTDEELGRGYAFPLVLKANACLSCGGWRD